MRILFPLSVSTLLASTLFAASTPSQNPRATTRSDDASAPRAALLMYDKLVGPHDAAS